MADTTAEVVPAKTRAIIFCVLLIIAGAGGVLLAGGHPRSNWFYPFLLAVAAFSCLHIFRRGDRPLGLGDNPPKPVNTAVFWSAVAFAISVAVFYGYWTLLWNEMFTWPVALFLSAMSAVASFRQKRGHAYSMWPNAVLFLLFVAVLTLVKAMGRI